MFTVMDFTTHSSLTSSHRANGLQTLKSFNNVANRFLHLISYCDKKPENYMVQVLNSFLNHCV